MDTAYTATIEPSSTGFASYSGYKVRRKRFACALLAPSSLVPIGPQVVRERKASFKYMPQSHVGAPPERMLRNLFDVLIGLNAYVHISINRQKNSGGHLDPALADATQFIASALAIVRQLHLSSRFARNRSQRTRQREQQLHGFNKVATTKRGPPLYSRRYRFAQSAFSAS